MARLEETALEIITVTPGRVGYAAEEPEGVGRFDKTRRLDIFNPA